MTTSEANGTLLGHGPLVMFLALQVVDLRYNVQ